jgi:methyl coenzyme M reductase beta subunit
MSGGNAITFIAYISDSVRATGGGGIQDENIQVVRVSFDKALQLVHSDKAMDTTTAFLLQYGYYEIIQKLYNDESSLGTPHTEEHKRS